MLLYHADVVESIERADSFHIDAEVTDVDFSAIVREVNADVESDSESIRMGLASSSQHDLYQGEGRFVDDRTVEIASGDEEGARI
ncbi:MAG: mycothione reductase [Natrialbaceae archaeon]|jgi:mycothione reductase